VFKLVNLGDTSCLKLNDFSNSVIICRELFLICSIIANDKHIQIVLISIFYNVFMFSRFFTSKLCDYISSLHFYTILLLLLFTKLLFDALLLFESYDSHVSL